MAFTFLRRKIRPWDNLLYQKAIEALEANGYKVHMHEDLFNRKWALIRQQSDEASGSLFVVADRKPCFLFFMIGELFWKGFKNFIWNECGTYNQMKRIIKIKRSTAERSMLDIKIYWPDGSNIGAFSEYGDGKWLSIVQKVCGG